MGLDPLTLAMLASAASTGASALGNISQGRAQGKENRLARKSQQRKENLIDELLRSIEGGGRFANLFKTDEAAFQKSFVEPAKQRFSSQIAPQIQQQAIASGTQRGSGVDDQLLRAGVDLDQMLNQNFMQFQQQGQNNISNVLSSILGQAPPQPFQAPPTFGQTLGAGASGFLESPGFAELLKGFGGQQQSPVSTSFSQDQRDILNPPAFTSLPATRERNRPGFATT
tara:strand:- start:5580 stop:6260 length:681 start_codon:yes stop_codon:yes gene_type:complete